MAARASACLAPRPASGLTARRYSRPMTALAADRPATAPATLALFYLVLGLLIASLTLIFVHPGKDEPA